MFRLTKCLTIGVVIAAALLVSTSSSEAGWHHRWGCCYDPCWTCCAPCWTPCCAPCVSWCAPCRVSRCYVDCCAPVCCDIGPTCCGAVTTAPAAVPSAASPTPAPPVPAPPRELNTPTPALPPAPGAEPAPAKPSAAILGADAGLLTVIVPQGAKVFVNGYETKSAGEQRQYVSYGLKPGFSYTYEVRVLAIRDGKPMEETRSVTLTAGQRTSVAFTDAKRNTGLALNF